MFQLTFAFVTPALVIGPLAERTRFSALLLFSTLWFLAVYVPVCHWVWGGGWLAKRGVLDFAGGIVVHVNAGVAALVAALYIGNRPWRSDAAAQHAWCGGMTWLLLKLIDATLGLRVTEEQESEGLDLAPHGERAISNSRGANSRGATERLSPGRAYGAFGCA